MVSNSALMTRMKRPVVNNMHGAVNSNRIGRAKTFMITSSKEAPASVPSEPTEIPGMVFDAMCIAIIVLHQRITNAFIEKSIIS